MTLTFTDCDMNGRRVNVLCKNGKIASIDQRSSVIPSEDAKGGRAKESQTIDCRGFTLLPGIVDIHVHFREPGNTEKEDFETGGRAAARGGVTTVLDMPNTNPATTSVGALEQKQKLAEKAIVNVGFHLGATKDNLKELQKPCGATGIKIYMGSSTGDLLLDDLNAIERVFRETDLPLIIHAENEARLVSREKEFAGRDDVHVHSEIRDAEAAALAVRTVIDLAEKTAHPAHITHISTQSEVELIRVAKEKGIPVTCDVAPHHLFLTASDYERLGTLARMNPPLRSKEDQEALWQGLRDGTIDCVATDHAPHLLAEKQQPYREAPSGVPGVETSLPLMLNAVHHGKIELKTLIERMSTAPAQLFRLGKKGKIQEGWDADLTLVDLSKTQTVKNEELVTKCGWSPFNGLELTGWPLLTVVEGKIIFNELT